MLRPGELSSHAESEHANAVVEQEFRRLERDRRRAPRVGLVARLRNAYRMLWVDRDIDYLSATIAADRDLERAENALRRSEDRAGEAIEANRVLHEQVEGLRRDLDVRKRAEASYWSIKAAAGELWEAVGRLLAEDLVDDCQECAVGKSESWARVAELHKRGRP